MATALDRHPDAGLAYAHWAATNEAQRSPQMNDVVSFRAAYEPALALFYCYGGSIQFWRRSSLVDLGGFDPSFTACGDLEVLVRHAAAKGNSVLVPALLGGFFQNPDGISRRNDVALAEEFEVSSTARSSMPLDRLYAVEPQDPASVAAGWTALGNLAMQIRVPWHAGPLRDSGFALVCYDRALAALPGYPMAQHNRYAALFQMGRLEDAESSLDDLSAAQASRVRGADLALQHPTIEPAVRGAVFAGVTETGARFRRMPIPPADAVAGELAGAKEYIASLEHHLSLERAESQRLRTELGASKVD